MRKNNSKKRTPAVHLHALLPPPVVNITLAPEFDNQTDSLYKLEKWLTNHLFETILRGAKELGLTEGLASGLKERNELLRKVEKLAGTIKLLHQQLQDTEEHFEDEITSM